MVISGEQFGSCVPDLVSFSRVDCRFWQGVSERFQGFAGFSCLSILTVTVFFLLRLGCLLPDLVFTYRYLLFVYRGSSRSGF